MKRALSPQFQSVQEWDDTFLALFPHRYDYLWAEHPNPGKSPEWKTESRHPLSDRLIQQGAFLYGVRFGPFTQYCMLDIDWGSSYHPVRDRFAWRRIKAALEPLGLVHGVICSSSYSKGLHIYFPFAEAQKTWAIALAVTTLLENAGFKLAPGQLEVFPNCKSYSPTGEISLYQGHRLPMQAGSYLLNEELEPIWGDQTAFVQYWQFAQKRNCVHERLVERILKQARRRKYLTSTKAEKYLNDLNAEIEQGWTGPGQTNRLLGRIAMRSYVFGHVLHTDTPLEGEALVADIVATAQALPGYQQWCRHQHELEEKARQWARCVESSHYFHYGTGKHKEVNEIIPQNPVEQSWNQQQSLAARERIRQALADLLEKGSLPSGIKERTQALISYGISGSTLYKHRDLWHPNHLQESSSGEPQKGLGQDCLVGATCPESPPNLLGETGCIPLSSRGYSCQEDEGQLTIGCNLAPEARLMGFQGFQVAQQQRQLVKRQVSRQRQMTRMQGYLDSGDPILVAEAITWAQLHPGLLDFRQLRLPIS